MQKYRTGRLYAATDIVGFLECEHLTTLSLQNLITPLTVAEQDELDKLVQDKGNEHERAYKDHLLEEGLALVDIGEARNDIDQRVQATRNAMQHGVEVIYQATLLNGELLGYADFLRKVSTPSALGNFSYEVWDTKLSRKPKPKVLVQLSFYSRLLALAQGVAPRMMHVVLGDKSTRSYPCADYAHYFDALLTRFLARVKNENASVTYPDPCAHCSLCRWEHLCDKRRLDDDHLSQVANITRVQIAKLMTAGVPRMADLADLKELSIAKMVPDTLERLRHQARLQVRAKVEGGPFVDVLPLDPECRRGFYRLPEPNPGDMFFDMEGDPWEEGGLEYLFGIHYLEGKEWQFKGFWGHDRQQERAAFENFIDFTVQRLQAFPGAHIWHYASYEETALKKLMTLHGTREAEVDNLLRQGRLVDLYRVVKESIRISEPRYSIKNVERFYLEAREGEVTNGGASIVWYEEWRETREQSLLNDIERYNKDDVRSTQLLRDWLLTLKPADVHWAPAPVEQDAGGTVGQLTEVEAKLVPYRQHMVETLPQDRLAWNTEEQARELTYQLLDFHRRAEKPVYWSLFARMDMSEEELLEDPECLAQLRADPASPPSRDKQSMVYTYTYPEQETKLRDGSRVTCADTGSELGKLMLDPSARRASLRQGVKKEPLPPALSLGPCRPIGSEVIRDALFRFADSLIAGDHRYPACEAVLSRDAPRLSGHQDGEPLIQSGNVTCDIAADVVTRLDSSYLFIQGPPGSGKTYTGRYIILELLKAGKRIGITSNSHKPIHHLLGEVVKLAKAQGFQLNAVKKASSDNPDSEFPDEPMVRNLYTNQEVLQCGAQLLAGTAWLFSDPRADQKLDYLFVDEAGQVALATLIAMGTSTRNIVLLGDQMQLSQPIQGVHPGRSGDSSLDYLLNGRATVEANRGLFLETTWRMHPDVCRFISDAVYESRLEPEGGNANRVLVLGKTAHPHLRPSGIVFAKVDHTGCGQQSQEEAQLIRAIYLSALTQQFFGSDGKLTPMTPENILVVAPYNMQVNLLRTMLPAGARVGTVDKFQGQEAEVVLISMTTSSQAELSRHMHFLFSKNRLNVAISRTKCLAVLVANPALLATRCTTPEQMSLVNTLCWAASVPKS